MGKSIDLPVARVRCGDEQSTKRRVEAWSELTSQLFECIDTEACATRADADQQQPEH